MVENKNEVEQKIIKIMNILSNMNQKNDGKQMLGGSAPADGATRSNLPTENEYMCPHCLGKVLKSHKAQHERYCQTGVRPGDVSNIDSTSNTTCWENYKTKNPNLIFFGININEDGPEQRENFLNHLRNFETSPKIGHNVINFIEKMKNTPIFNKSFEMFNQVINFFNCSHNESNFAKLLKQ